MIARFIIFKVMVGTIEVGIGGCMDQSVTNDENTGMTMVLAI